MTHCPKPRLCKAFPLTISIGPSELGTLAGLTQNQFQKRELTSNTNKLPEAKKKKRRELEVAAAVLEAEAGEKLWPMAFPNFHLTRQPISALTKTLPS
ncbi:hypothetical protein NC653_000606 [Populus alba x Populus x berolinensis]|uniref:Uncharacterized protein n=1 Tax=Populus alba x Populus x berolinensis TaxID=444605 RepID=A0AAD6RJP7_9ROSI|nr:hypothetical protein NC653_000606 [Populus alba x Populus x berolinensis]